VVVAAVLVLVLAIDFVSLVAGVLGVVIATAVMVVCLVVAFVRWRRRVG
jgi:hypothetical protein